MPATYSKTSLAKVILDRGYDDVTAANHFGLGVRFIASERNTPAFQKIIDALRRERQRRTRRETTNISTEITTEEVTEEKSERNKEDIRLQNEIDELHEEIDNIDITGTGTESTFYKVTPFYRGVKGRIYRGVNPFPKERLLPFHRGVLGKPYRGIRGSGEKREQNATDILKLFDGVPELVADYMWDLIMDRLPDPTELRDAQTTYNLIQSRIQNYVTGYTEPFTNTLKNKLDGVETGATADLTAVEIISLLEGLAPGTRLDINWFDGNLNIPTNTASWHGAFQLNTAYSSGSIVTDNNSVFIYISDVADTNTTRPADDSKAEHLDVGSPLDLTNAAKSGLTFTFTRRNGNNVNMTITSADILTAIQAMNTMQKTAVRNAIGAASSGHTHSGYASSGHTHSGYALSGHLHNYASPTHTHDSRYFTESEMNTKLAGKSNVGHTHTAASVTAANVLASVLAFTTSQKGQARVGLEVPEYKTLEWGEFWSGTLVSIGKIVFGISDRQNLSGNGPGISIYARISSGFNIIINEQGNIVQIDRHRVTTTTGQTISSGRAYLSTFYSGETNSLSFQPGHRYIIFATLI